MFRGLLFVAVIVVQLLIPSKNLDMLQAEADDSNMRTLLEKLNERIANEQEFQIAIRFVNPLIPEEESVWIIPDSRENAEDEVSRTISEIGDDYICFDILGGAARFIECTPFSNIVSIRYLVQ